MNIIRNPNKFIHLFSVAIAILSAYGMHHLVERQGKPLPTSLFWKILAGIGAASLVTAVYISSSTGDLVTRFHTEFHEASQWIVANMSHACLRLAVFSSMFAVLWYGKSDCHPPLPVSRRQSHP